VYAGALLLVLLAVELGYTATSLPVQAKVVLAVLVAAAVVSNIGFLRHAGSYLRGQSAQTGADLGALQIARPLIGRDYTAHTPAFAILERARVSSLFAAEQDLGPLPADTPAEIAAAPEDARKVADTELIAVHQVKLRNGVPMPPGRARPSVEAITGGVIAGRGPCLTFQPAAVAPARPADGFVVTVPPRGLLLGASGASATVGVRRFADEFQPVGTLMPAGSAVLRIAADRTIHPWRVLVRPADRATVCGLG
jgi:hypothetical protein